MLSEIITKVNQRILSCLLEEKASLSELARRTKTTKANIFHSLKKLEKQDLVRKEIQGRTHLYYFNYLHSQAKKIADFFLEEKKKAYNHKINGFPSLFDFFLKNTLQENYHGCIFFGSSLTGKYQDIDVFVIAEKAKEVLLKKELKQINKKISLVLGTKEELKKGFQEEDMLYKNILKGIPFGCEDFILELRNSKPFSRRKDITERFLLGYREIISCLEFIEKEYLAKHLDKGITDLIYSALNYFDLFPANDLQARKMFKKKFNFVFSNQPKEAKKQAEKIGELIL